MSIASSVATIAEVFARWVDPERREKVILKEAIAAAEELFQIYDKTGKYAKMSDKELKKWGIHYTKQWNAWKDGTP